MKLSYRWLKEWLDIPVDPGALAAALTNVGLQLAGMEHADEDTILDLEITVNRPDCLSVLGAAREAAAIFGLPAPQFTALSTSPVLRINGPDGSFTEKELPIRVILEEPDLCSRYCAQIIAGVKIGPSPGWLARRLESAGIRTINNVVDISNYVMLELGQPTHAFDYDRLTGATIRVRKANAERLEMIDEKTRLLESPMLVIADAVRAVAIGGIMGGKDSEVSAATTNILLESAYFKPESVRATAKALELSTDASYRFERGADPNMQAMACRRAAYLLQQLAGGEPYPVLDVCAKMFAAVQIDLRQKRIERILGQKIDTSFTDSTLIALGFHKRSQTSWEVPSFRVDIYREIDLIEEIARHYGYNRFPETLPEAGRKYQPDYPTYDLERAFSAFLRAAKIDEASTYSIAPEGEIKILNPISENMGYLRTSLLPGLLESIAYNRRHRNTGTRLFEIGRIFKQDGEYVALGIAMETSFQELKGILNAAFYSLCFEPAQFDGEQIRVAGQIIGFISERMLDTDKVAVSEINLELLQSQPRRRLKYEEIIPYPFVERDVSFIVSETIPFSELENLFRRLDIPLLRSFKLVDRYKGPNTPSGKISLTFQLIFQAIERTLTSEEVDDLYVKIVDEFLKQFDAELRK